MQVKNKFQNDGSERMDSGSEWPIVATKLIHRGSTRERRVSPSFIELTVSHNFLLDTGMEWENSFWPF